MPNLCGVNLKLHFYWILTLTRFNGASSQITVSIIWRDALSCCFSCDTKMQRSTWVDIIPAVTAMAAEMYAKYANSPLFVLCRGYDEQRAWQYLPYRSNTSRFSLKTWKRVKTLSKIYHAYQNNRCTIYNSCCKIIKVICLQKSINGIFVLNVTLGISQLIFR